MLAGWGEEDFSVPDVVTLRESMDFAGKYGYFDLHRYL